MPVLVLALVLLASVSIPAHSDQPVRQQAILIREYTGPHQAQYFSEYDRVRLLVRQAQLEVSSRLGLLQYREGFQYPLAIRFEDDSPVGLENALAYVQLMQSSKGFEQELVINLNELTAHPMDFDTVFYHEMTHAVMNDAVGGSASARIPHWLQEGLAVYISGEGDQRVQQAAGRLHTSQVHALIYPLDGTVYGNAYPQYYLAIKYMLETYSINAVQGLVRNLVAGKSLVDSIQDCMNLTWGQYQQNVRDYSLKVFHHIAVPDYLALPS